MLDAGSAEDDATRDVDVIRGGNEIADGIEKGGHGLTRENISREENAGENGQKSELHGLGLRFSFARDEDS